MKTRLQIILLGFFLISAPAFGQQEATKFHEMKIDDYICDNVKTILDNFAIALQNDPTSKGYIILYGGRKIRGRLPRQGEAEARISYWEPYMHNTRGVDNSRVDVIDGGYREDLMAEMWVVPAGAKPPRPTPTLKESDIKFRRGKIKRMEICGED